MIPELAPMRFVTSPPVTDFPVAPSLMLPPVTSGLASVATMVRSGAVVIDFNAASTWSLMASLPLLTSSMPLVPICTVMLAPAPTST